ncbi:hypothetical protein P3T73_15465 [Kiritimatiellota bacterium B12222]|nr:hypothetical protein P3T73_15465 [Kiritimatiellota bacterium B12222]
MKLIVITFVGMLFVAPFVCYFWMTSERIIVHSKNDDLVSSLSQKYWTTGEDKEDVFKKLEIEISKSFIKGADKDSVIRKINHEFKNRAVWELSPPKKRLLGDVIIITLSENLDGTTSGKLHVKFSFESNLLTEIKLFDDYASL